MIRSAARGLSALLAGAALTLAAAAPAAAEDTPVTVRVISQGAKFIGTSMGGARVTITDAVTGELLASGKTQGSTGDTGHIMKQAHPRGTALAKGGAAKFATTLDLAAPRRIKVTAYGPTAQTQAANTVSATQWVLPGKGIAAGDGLRLEMPGFAVDVTTPPAHVDIDGPPARVRIAANVTMMCGCPITPGGTWDANAYEVGAIVTRNGSRMGEQPLSYAGSESQFATDLTLERPGTYEVAVYAYNPDTGNTGVDKVTFAVE